jgi:hypothetical protein
MTETAHHCAEHSGSMQMLAQMERNISDLYSKHEETTKLLTDLRLEMSRRATGVEVYLQGLNLAIGRMEDLLKNQAALEAQRYDTINAEIRKLGIRVEALEGYSWLGAAFNKVRDNAIKLFLGGLLSLLVYALVHSADFADAIKMIGRF